jgi:hypothetical protein
MHFTLSPDGRLFHVTGFGKVWTGPYLTEIATGSRWAEDENDKFPSDQQWSDVFEQMISWFAGKFPTKYHGRVVTRLRSTRRTRDETFAEIIAAYFIENVCGYPVMDWEPEFAQGKFADFTMVVPLRTSSPEILVEVKAPSWTGERVEATWERIENLEAQRLSVIEQESASQLNARLAREKDSLKRVNSQRKYGDDLNADRREDSQPVRPATLADTYGSCAATRADRVSRTTRLQFAPRPTRGSPEPSCESDFGGRAESAAGRIGISNATKVGSPCGANR